MRHHIDWIHITFLGLIGLAGLSLASFAAGVLTSGPSNGVLALCIFGIAMFFISVLSLAITVRDFKRLQRFAAELYKKTHDEDWFGEGGENVGDEDDEVSFDKMS